MFVTLLRIEEESLLMGTLIVIDMMLRFMIVNMPHS